MPIILQQRPTVSVGDVEKGAVSFANYLDTGETLTGTPLVDEVTTTDLTLGGKAVSSAALTILGESVSAGQAVQFTMSGQKANTLYTIRVTATTTASRTVVRDAQFECV
jgi:hypothetical protein